MDYTVYVQAGCEFLTRHLKQESITGNHALACGSLKGGHHSMISGYHWPISGDYRGACAVSVDHWPVSGDHGGGGGEGGGGGGGGQWRPF